MSTALPTPSHLLGGLLITALAIASLISYRIWLHPLAKFPGPKWWAASRLPWVRHMVRGRMWRELELLHEKHGSFVRIAPNELSVLSPQAWSDIYTSRPLLPKEPTSQTPPLNGAHSLFTAVGDDHRRIRGSLASGFSDKALRDQSPIIEHHASALVSRLRRELAVNPILDVQTFFGYAALDAITDLSYGSPLDGLPHRNTHTWLARFFLHGKFSTIRMCTCWFWPLDQVLDFIALSLTRKQRARNWAIFSAKIEARMEQGDVKRADLMTPVIGKVAEHIEDGPKGRGITKPELLSHMLASVVANSQLTTVALTSSVYFLLHNESAMERLLEEIRGAFSSEEAITVTSTQPLAYLDAVLNEVLRVHHPTPINLPRVVPREGRTIDGTFVPGNTIVGINLHVIQTSPACWVDGLSFHPERFLPSSHRHYDTRFDADVKAAYMPFSTGPRNCIGGKLFFAEARVVLAKMLWNFDLRLADGNAEGWLDKAAYIVYEPKALRVELVERKLGGE